MATGYSGSNVTNKYNGNNYTWIDYTEVTVSSTPTTYTITWQVSFRVMHGTSTVLKLSKGNFSAALVVNGATVRSFTSTVDKQVYGGYANRWIVITYSQTFNRTHENQTITWYSWCKGVSPSSWKGTSTISTQSITLSPRPVGYIEYNSNGGTGSSFQVQKWYDEPLVLAESEFTKTNYSKVQWNTAANGSGTNYPLTGTFTENINNTAAEPYYLYMQWHLDYIKPIISDFRVFRSNSSGVEDAEGTYIKVTFHYEGGYEGSQTTGTQQAPRIQIYIDDNVSAAYDVQQASTAANFVSPAFYGTSGYDVAHTHNVQILVFDSIGGSGNAATQSGVVPTAIYPLDLKVESNTVYMGVMAPASSDTKLRLGGPCEVINGPLTASFGYLTAANAPTEPNLDGGLRLVVVNSTDSFQKQEGYIYLIKEPNQ